MSSSGQSLNGLLLLMLTERVDVEVEGQHDPLRHKSVSSRVGVSRCVPRE